MEFMPTARGGRYLLLDGYKYIKNRSSRTFTFWRCEYHKTCTATVTTSLDDTLNNRDKAIHNHPPDHAKIAADKKVTELKETVKEERSRPIKRLYSEAFNFPAVGENDDYVAASPSFAKMKTTLYRERHKILPKLPRTRSEIVLEGEWSHTLDGRPFLMADKGNEDKILVFSTEENLQKLSSSQSVFMDGTFTVSPRLFLQLYTLHVPFLGQMIPVVFALLPDKSRATYIRLFGIVTNLCHQRQLPLHPQSIHTDFEVAVIQGAQIVFPAARLSGCFFHFTQCIWRKVQALGLAAAYSESPEVRKFIRRLAVLPMVPFGDLDNVWIDLHADSPSETRGMDALCDYMVTTWLDDRPKFAIPRTNNHLDSFHSALRKAFHSPHPNIFTLVSALRSRQQRATRVKEAQIMRILQQFRRGERGIRSYMDALSFTIKLH